MTPEQFISKWKAVELKERSAAHSHFIDLCKMLDEPAPTDVDPNGEWYAFEKGASKSTGGDGWADVWKRGHFGWEYKGKRKDLDAAFGQLQQYALALENPPLLVVCDMDRFRIHTNWTNSVSEVIQFDLDGLRDPELRQKLKWVLSDPERLKPGKTRQALTEEAAAEFSTLAQRLRERGHPSEIVAHFINRLVFCMFAEDVDLLPNKMFKRLLENSLLEPAEFVSLATDLFKAMKDGGRVGFEHVAWFNGGLFDNDLALPLNKEDIVLTLRAANLDWSEIDPSILGTLFERGLDPSKRSQLGAHYTDREKIMFIVDPVIVSPWLTDWSVTKQQIVMTLSRAANAGSAAARTRATDQATTIFRQYLDSLRSFRVLDPACGSGNFLYLALRALKDLEHRASIEAEALGLQREFPRIGPSAVRGIEINPYAAELARVSVWIGEIQWMRRNGFGVARDPILKPLDTIECRDALLNPDGTEAKWPDADVIIGNPPFLGGNVMRRVLGSEAQRIRAVYSKRVPAKADLVCHWFAKAAELLHSGRIRRCGLVGTTSIKVGASRTCSLDKLARGDVLIFNAHSNLEWTVEGADVRVVTVCASRAPYDGNRYLNGVKVDKIEANLGGAHGKALFDADKSKQLQDNLSLGFDGFYPVGDFYVSGELARTWLTEPLNPNGRSNADVLRPHWNGDDLVNRWSGRWIIDFGTEMSAAAAALYQSPYSWVREHVYPARVKNNRKTRREFWWRFGEASPGVRKGSARLTRFIATPKVSKHRVFVFLSTMVSPNAKVCAIMRDDEVTFGILSSSFHVSWAEMHSSRHGVGDDLTYNTTRTFETFPFPDGLTPNLPAATFQENYRATLIAMASVQLQNLRDAWLNPADLVIRRPEVVPGFPDRLLPIDDKAAEILKKRTLTNLYNSRPDWLQNAHRDLDAAVAQAYGWPSDIQEKDALLRLFELNQLKSGAKNTLV